MDINVGTVWIVGNNLTATKTELKLDPAFETSILKDVGNI